MQYASAVFTLLVTLVLPAAAAVWLALKRKGYLKPLLLGAATFFVFQILLRLPLLQLVVEPMPWFVTMGILSPVLTALFYGATAALFEEGGRWLTMRLFMRNRTRAADGIAFGLGHGGIEAVLLVGVNMAVTLALVGIPGDSGAVFAAGFERLSTMAVHVAWSVMVLRGVVHKKPGWLLLAFVLHTLVDAGVLLLQPYLSVFLLEVLLGGFAAVMIVITVILYQKDRGGQTT